MNNLRLFVSMLIGFGVVGFAYLETEKQNEVCQDKIVVTLNDIRTLHELTYNQVIEKYTQKICE